MRRALLLIFAVILSLPLRAQFTSIDLGPETSQDLQTYTHGANCPLGGDNIIIGGVPFSLSLLSNTPATTGVIQPSPGVFSNSIPVPQGTHARVLYALINSEYGEPGADFGQIIVTGAGGESAAWELVEGVNVRDQNEGSYENNVTDPTAVPTYFVNRASTTASAQSRLDRYTFVLPDSFDQDTIASVIFQGVAYQGIEGAPFIAALTFSTVDPTPPPLSQYQFTTIAGSAAIRGGVNGSGSNARFYSPASLAVDTNGNVFVTDRGNDTIRLLTRNGSSWTVSTIAGKVGIAGHADGTNNAATFNGSTGVTVDPEGNLFVADTFNGVVRKLTHLGTNWISSTIAGLAGSVAEFDGTNGAARFNNPQSPTLDPAGNLYVVDYAGNTVRELSPMGTNWVVSTIGGRASVGGSRDGTNGYSLFYEPGAAVFGPDGNLYVTDQGNDTIRRLTPTGSNWISSTITGTVGVAGWTDGASATAQFNYSGGITIDAFGDIFVADTFNETIRELTPSGSGWIVSTLGGYATLFGSADGFGSAARFNGPNGITVDSHGRLFVADFGNNTIRQGMPFPILAATLRDANGFHFRQIGPPGRFIFQASADLNTWVSIASNTVSGATTLYITDPDASAVGHTFYRSVSAP